MKILGLSCFYHESAAALIVDGEILAAAEEERFSQIKHDASFPSQAINFCLKQGNIEAYDLDYVVFYEKPLIKFSRNLICSLRYFPKSSSFFIDSMRSFLTEKLWIKSTIATKLKIDEAKILFVPHHLCHAAASFYPSPFKRAAFLTLDAVGEWTVGSFGVGVGNKLYPQREMRFPHSVGMLYSTFTAYLGFTVGDGEYKVMGMAGYGKPKYCQLIKTIYQQYNDGSIRLNLDYFSFHQSSRKMYSNLFVKKFSGLDRFDLAASLQKCTEEIILNMVEAIYRKTNQSYLVYGGGVALNSVVNARIVNTSSFRDIFIFPAAGDDGGAVGAALYVYHHLLDLKRKDYQPDVFLGAGFSRNDIEKFLQAKRIQYKKMSHDNLVDYIASQLIKQKVVGLFEGRAEFGPRALGHRSILADPRNPKMKDRVNSKIKFREEFRPFAPAVLAEHYQKFFKNFNKNLANYMLGTFLVNKITKKEAPAIVHVDGSSRAQIVQKNYTGRLRKILELFYKKTRVPMVLNTSFNLRGKPIVNSPQDAYNTFLKSGLDILVLENFVIKKKRPLL